MANGFSSTSYFYDLLALTVVLVGITFVPNNALLKRLVYIAAGAYLLFFIAPRLLFFYIVFWSGVAVLQWLVAVTSTGRWDKVGIWLAIVLTLLPMVYWKLNYESVNEAFNVVGNAALGVLSPGLQEIDYSSFIIIPIGLSFATFRAIDLLIKTWLGKYGALSPDRLFFYGFFPPVQVIGPIIEYDEIAGRSERFQAPEPQDINAGLLRIVSGFLKLLLVTVVLAPFATIFQSFPDEPVWLIWAYLFGYTWFFYLNFSAFSDMAIGFARVTGFELKENFSYPFLQKNIADFWNSWHMSLSRFAQRNVYVPMGGYRASTQYIATFATIMVIALWHDLTVGMILFGLYHGCGLVVHRMWVNRFGESTTTGLSALPKIVLTYLFVTCSFPLLVLPLEQAIRFYLAMLGLL